MMNPRSTPLLVRRLVWAVAVVLTACHRGTATQTVPPSAPSSASPAATAPERTTAALPPSLHGLTTQPTELTMRIGEQRLYSAIVQPARNTVRYTTRYSSSAPQVATVDSSGAVNALAAGRAVVTVVVQSNGGAGLAATTLSGSMTLTVIKP